MGFCTKKIGDSIMKYKILLNGDCPINLPIYSNKIFAGDLTEFIEP